MNARTAQRIGTGLSGFVIAFLLFDSVIKFTGMQPVTDSFAQLGYPVDLAPAIGALELACVLLYAFPRTAVVGAILLTAHLGGAIASHTRIASPLFSHTLFGVYVGLLVWGGLWLREGRLHALVPLRR